MERKNHIDFTTLICALTLMFMSLGIVYSASATIAAKERGTSEFYLIQHAIKVAIGIVCLFFFMRLDYHRIQRLSKLILIGAILLLIATILIGIIVQGAKRWLNIGPISLQPSEFTKYALLFHLATLIVKKGEFIQDLKRGYVPMLIWIAMVTVLVLLQPNFSMGIMIFGLSLSMLYIGNVRLRHLFMTFVTLIPAILIFMVFKPYSIKRITGFINSIFGSSHNLGYQLSQSIIAFGNGGIFGVGPGESKQRDLFLPYSYNDFVYSIIGEEYGFLGTMTILFIFFLIMYRGFKIARYAPDSFGRFTALAITLAITTNALANACVTVGLFPTTGIPMPFVSYGGTSMIVSSSVIGILLNISSQTDMHPRIQEIPILGEVNADTTNTRKVY